MEPPPGEEPATRVNYISEMDDGDGHARRRLQFSEMSSMKDDNIDKVDSQ